MKLSNFEIVTTGELLMRRWAAKEAALRKADRRYGDAQERAEMSIMKGHDYDTDSTNNKKKR